MISCDEAVVICNKSQYKEASFSEKLKLKLHNLFCSNCAIFSRKNKQLSLLFHKAKLYTLGESEKNTLKKMMKEHS